MRLVVVIGMISIVISFVLCGCKIYSWKVLENSEFPDQANPAELDTDVLEKYTVGNVIVHPRILYMDGEMTTQQLFVVFFSRTNTSKVAIKNVTMWINENELEYGDSLIDVPASDWSLYSRSKKFYVCSIGGTAINYPKEKLLKNGVQLSLTISVENENGKAYEKQINAEFVPKKRAVIGR